MSYWHPVPVGMRMSPPVTQLAALLKIRDARLLLIQLWEWTKQHTKKGDGIVRGPEATRAIESGAEWHRRRGAFVVACKALGWVVDEPPDALRVVPWKDVMTVEWPESFDERGGGDYWPRGSVGDVFARDGFFCRYCACPVSSDPTIDHIQPRKYGGLHGVDNLVVACRSCNSRKGARTPEQAGMLLLPVPLQ